MKFLVKNYGLGMDLLFTDPMKMKVIIFLLSTFVWCIRFFLIIDFLNVHYLFLLNLYMFMFTDRKYLELMFQWSMGHCGIYHIIIRPASTYAISGARVAQWVRSLDLTTHTSLSPWSPWYSWNIAQSGVKTPKNQSINLCNRPF
jgi:hypothetical protein